MGGEEGSLGTGEVILGEVGDLLEELGAALVVEEPRGEGFWGGGQAGEGFVQDGLVEGGGGGGGHDASWSFKYERSSFGLGCRVGRMGSGFGGKFGL